MQRRKGWRALVALAAVALLAAGCGDDDDDGDDASASASASAPADEPADDEAEGSSTVEVEMVDFGYVVSGPLATGVQTFRTTNSGDEIHMMGVGKLKEGVTVEDVVAALAESGDEGAPEEDAEADDGAADEETSRAAQEGGDDTGEGEEGGEGHDSGEGEEGGDPFEELFEAELGTPGHILLPGVSQSITLEDDLDVGSYALICFIPSEGDGVPHFAKGMVQGLEVVESGEGGEIPEADAEYTLPDGAEPEGPTEVEGGEATFEITNSGEVGKDFIIAQPGEGKTFEDFDTFFVQEFEGEDPPQPGVADRVPGVVAGSTFEIGAGETIYLTADLGPGTWALVSTNNTESDDGGETEDFILEITVT